MHPTFLDNVRRGGGAHFKLDIDKFLGGGSSTDFKYLTLEKYYFWVMGSANGVNGNKLR